MPEALRHKASSVPNPKFARLLSGHFWNFGFKRDTRIISLLVSLWFGCSLRSKLRMRANFRTATLAAWKAYPDLVRRRANGQGERPPGALPRALRRIPTIDQAGWRGEKTPPYR